MKPEGHAVDFGESVLQVEKVSPWNHKWERTLTVATHRGRMEMDQRITLMTPYVTRIATLRYDWVANYLTQEMGPDLIRSLLFKYYADKKELKEPEKRLLVAKFLFQVGWYDLAERDLLERFRRQTGNL